MGFWFLQVSDILLSLNTALYKKQNKDFDRKPNHSPLTTYHLPKPREG